MRDREAILILTGITVGGVGAALAIMDALHERRELEEMESILRPKSDYEIVAPPVQKKVLDMASPLVEREGRVPDWLKRERQKPRRKRF